MVYPGEHNLFLRLVYDSPREGLGVGINLFYYQVCASYVGITRRECTAFLTHQGNYQITREFHKIPNRSTIAKTSNERWEIDHADFNRFYSPQQLPKHNRRAAWTFVNQHNNTYGPLPGLHSFKHILVCVDTFSKKVWAETRDAMQRIIARANNTYPHILQHDNGAAFKGAFAQWVTQHNAPLPPDQEMTEVETSPANPQTNGEVERMNNEIRKRIKEGFVRHNNLEWVAWLQRYCDNINGQRHARSRWTPNELWRPGYNPPAPNARPRWHVSINDHSSNAAIQQKHKAHQIELAYRRLKHRPTKVFRVGDLVRIAMEAKHEEDTYEFRRRVKDQLQKKINAITYTVPLYRVVAIVNGTLPANMNALRQLGVRAWDVRNEQYRLRTCLP